MRSSIFDVALRIEVESDEPGIRKVLERFIAARLCKMQVGTYAARDTTLLRIEVVAAPAPARGGDPDS